MQFLEAVSTLIVFAVCLFLPVRSYNARLAIGFVVSVVINMLVFSQRAK